MWDRLHFIPGVSQELELLFRSGECPEDVLIWPITFSCAACSRINAASSLAAFAVLAAMNVPLRSVLGEAGKSSALRIVCSALQVRSMEAEDLMWPDLACSSDHAWTPGCRRTQRLKSPGTSFARSVWLQIDFSQIRLLHCAFANHCQNLPPNRAKRNVCSLFQRRTS